MPNHAMQPHHHPNIQTANSKKQKQWVQFTHTYLLPMKEQNTNHTSHDSSTKITFFVNMCVCESKLR